MTTKLLVLAISLVAAVGLAGCAADDGEESTNDGLGDDPVDGMDDTGGDVDDNMTDTNETNTTNPTG